MKPKSLLTSWIAAGGLVLVLSCLTLPPSRGVVAITSQLMWAIFMGSVGFLIFKTGHISRWRAIFFIILAWGFLFQFKATLLGLRGQIFSSPEIQEVPFCHIAIVSQIFNYGYQQILAF